MLFRRIWKSVEFGIFLRISSCQIFTLKYLKQLVPQHPRTPVIVTPQGFGRLLRFVEHRLLLLVLG